MSYFRSYFEKNNTIIKNTLVNTARNPNTEIYYGVGVSRFIFKIDLTELSNRVTNGEYVIDANTKHTLHLTNTIFGDESNLGGDRGTGRKRASSFDLVLFKIDEFWDEGVGFDYEETYDYNTGEKLYNTGPSNWYDRTRTYEWTTEGIYTGTPVSIQTIHFDRGNEDIHVDITDYVNGIIVSGNTNYGLGLAFPPEYEQLTEEDKGVSFFTKYTQTFFEPYVETYFKDEINDDRYNFIEETPQNLYLYVTKGTNFYDLDVLPTVDIQDSTKTPITGLTGLTVTKIKKGVYSVTFSMDTQYCQDNKFYYDVWKNIVIDGVTLSNITQKFVPKPYSSLYSIGKNETELIKYSVQYSGVRMNEKIKRGEKRKIVVSFKSLETPKNTVFDNVYYRIFVKEGNTQVEVFDWTKLDKTNENSFILDTSYFIPREYFLEIKGNIYNEEIFYKNVINFEIVSEK